MSVDYIVASLPSLAFDQPAPISWDKFAELCGGQVPEPDSWRDLDTQMRNALAEARGGAKWKRPASGCSLYWRNRVLACFQEKDIARRDALLDKTWWDAAGELTDLASPLGRGALATYAVRLKIALKRSRASAEAGNAAFERLTAATKTAFTAN